MNRPGALWRGLLRALLTATFLWAGVAKVSGPRLFASDIAAFGLLPSSTLALALAYYLPWVEIGCALGLWSRRWKSGALLLAGALLGMFSLALSSAWARGLRLDCGCFGAGAPGTATNYSLALGRNLLMLGACAVLGWTGPGSRSGGATPLSRTGRQESGTD